MSCTKPPDHDTVAKPLHPGADVGASLDVLLDYISALIADGSKRRVHYVSGGFPNYETKEIYRTAMPIKHLMNLELARQMVRTLRDDFGEAALDSDEREFVNAAKDRMLAKAEQAAQKMVDHARATAEKIIADATREAEEKARSIIVEGVGRVVTAGVRNRSRDFAHIKRLTFADESS